MKLTFPKTLRGWKKLYCIFVRKCPYCHRPLQQDWALYDDGDWLWCLPCGGIQVPRGVIKALKFNTPTTEGNK